jgi:hypothetical protein
MDDTRPYLYRTNDYGKTWTKIVGGLPEDDFTRTIRADPNRRGLLYCGTELGINVSFDDGASWQKLETNLPVVPIWDLIVKGTDLVAATHGRSFWILDDITPLHQLHDDLAGQSAFLFKPRDTIRFRLYGRAFDRKSAEYVNYKMTGPVTVAFRPTEAANGAKTEHFYDAGRNPPEGVIIHYWLRETPQGPVSLSILDADGNEIRTYRSKKAEGSKINAADEQDAERMEATGEEETASDEEVPADEAPWVTTEPGANRFVWDYRYPGPTKQTSAAGTGGRRPIQDESLMPKAAPGNYQVRLTVGDQSWTQPFTILIDPRLPVSEDDLQAQFALKSAIRDRLSEVHVALNQIDGVRGQLGEWEKRAKGSDNAARVRESAKSLRDQLEVIERELVLVDVNKGQPGPAKIKEKLATLSAMIDESDHAPTQGANEVYDMLSDQVAEQRRLLQELMDEHIPGFGDLVQSLAIPPIVV